MVWGGGIGEPAGYGMRICTSLLHSSDRASKKLDLPAPGKYDAADYLNDAGLRRRRKLDPVRRSPTWFDSDMGRQGLTKTDRVRQGTTVQQFRSAAESMYLEYIPDSCTYVS
jgi:hypothetical protein